jgi:UDP-glucose 4-epimerase
MKIFITGSSGFIGSHLVPLLEQDHDVYSMQSDLLNFSGVEQEVLTYQPDIIVHLAARTEVEKSFTEQITFSEINYVGSVNLIESAIKVKTLKNFVFASTMEVYGWQPISDYVLKYGTPYFSQAFNEHTVANPNAPYAVAKYGVEKYLEYAHRSQQLPFTAIRQTNAYGRQDNDFFVTEQIITQMIKNPAEIKLGYSEPYRNFIYVTDLLDAWQQVINNPDIVNDGKIFTIGPDNPVKIRHYAEMIADMMNWRGEIAWNTKPSRPGEIYWLNSDHQLITQTLGWAPKVALKDGLQMTIDFWQNKLCK